jgi:hypothetical protein
MMTRTLRWLALILLVLTPELGFAGLYLADPTVGPPLEFSDSTGTLHAGVSITSSDPALTTDPAYIQLAQTHDVFAFGLAFTPGSDNLYFLDAHIGATPLSDASFVTGSPNGPTSAGKVNSATGIWIFPHPVTRESDGSYDTPSLLLLYPLGTFTEPPASHLTILVDMNSGVEWGFGIFPESVPVPEPWGAALTLCALAALALARRSPPTRRRRPV